MHFPCSKQRVGVRETIHDCESNVGHSEDRFGLSLRSGLQLQRTCLFLGFVSEARGVSVEVWRRQHLHKCVCVDFCQSNKANTVSTTALPNTSVDNIIQKTLAVMNVSQTQAARFNQRGFRAADLQSFCRSLARDNAPIGCSGILMQRLLL